MKDLILAENLRGSCLKGRPIGENASLNFSLKRGEVGAILDTPKAFSLFQLIMGMGKVEEGSLNLFESPMVESVNMSITWRKMIGFAGAHKGLLSNLSLFDNVNLPAKYHGHYENDSDQRHLATEQLQAMNIEEELWSLRPNQVSGHIIKKTLLARSVVLNPAILLLDCPSENFNWQKISFLRDWILRQKESGKAILIGSDNIPFVASLCDWMILPGMGEMNKDFRKVLDPNLLQISDLIKKGHGENHETIPH